MVKAKFSQVSILKVSKSWNFFWKFSILPKNEWNTRKNCPASSKDSFFKSFSFFGRMDHSKNCFCDLLTFRCALKSCPKCTELRAATYFHSDQSDCQIASVSAQIGHGHNHEKTPLVAIGLLGISKFRCNRGRTGRPCGYIPVAYLFLSSHPFFCKSTN